MPTSRFLDSDYVAGAVSDDLIVQFQPDGVDECGRPQVCVEFDVYLPSLTREKAA
jgi:hypothetical protein